jgi:hypothetical protein
MKDGSGLRQFLRSIIFNKFARKSANIHYTRQKEHWLHYYLPPDIGKTIDYLRAPRRITKQKMLIELVLRGIADYVGEGISVANEQIKLSRQHNVRAPVNKFTAMLKRWAKDQGADISKFF